MSVLQRIQIKRSTSGVLAGFVLAGCAAGGANAQTRMQFPTTKPFGPRTTSAPSTGPMSRPVLTRPSYGTPQNRVRTNQDRFVYKPYPTRHQTNEPIVYIGNTSACDGPELWTYAHEHQHFRDRGVHRSGVGLRIGYSDDNFNLSLHAGSPYYSHYGHSLHRRYVCEPVVYSPLYGSVYDIRWRYPRTSYSSAYPNENWGTASTEVVYVGATSVAPTYEHPAPAPQQQVPQASNIPEDIQSAAASLRNGHTGQAIDTLRNYVALNDTDTLASRALAVALLRNGDTASGVALIGLVYERDPSLASKPIDGQFWLGNDRALRELVRDVSGYANQAGTPSGWLTLAVLMQAEGRDYHARQMLERAERAGLQTRVLGPMLQATGSRRVVGRGLQ